MKVKAMRVLTLLLAMVLMFSLFPGVAQASAYEDPDLPAPIEGYDPLDPDNPYPYGLPVTEYIPEEEQEMLESGIALFASQGSIPDEMWDNTILRALEYTGYDVQRQKDKGQLYVYEYIASRLKTNDPDVLSDISYWESGSCPNGDETVADSSTPTGKAPNISYFESNGLVCASFATYYLCNYLPNIEGIDTSVVYNKAKEMGASGSYYYLTTVGLWKRTLDALANESGSGVTKYTDEDTAYDNLVPGDVVIFGKSDGTLTHVAIYAGEYYMYSSGGYNNGLKHFMIHVGNSRGPEISVIEWMSTSTGSKASDPVGFYHLDFNDIQSEGYIEVNKKDPSGNALSGATFVATHQTSGEQFVIGPTDSNGYAISAALPLGKYTVEETVFPSGYQASGTASWEVELTDSTPNMTITIDAENKLITGVAKIVKATTNGGSKAEWHFTVKDSGGNKVGDYVTDSSGVIALDLVPGTYSVTETDGAYKYWVNDPTPTKTVTVKANETATVTFTNQYRGQAQIVKTATNGGSVAGWHFTVKDSAENKVGDYVTDSSGVITLDLEPGTYTVTETDGAYQYWVNDPNPTKTVTVTAGQTAKVTFQNQYRGQAQIIKTATNGGSVEGWHFTVKNSAGNKVGDYVTDSTGIITLDLEPGTYSVTETDGEYKYWVNDPTPTKSVTVVAGQTAKVTFQNKWRGQAQIVKTATNGGSVEGWHFTVKDSAGNKVGDYVTDSTGIITLDLEPGTYTVTETDGKYTYWHNDPNPEKKVTVVAGQTAKVTFLNEWIGKAKIIKTATNNGSVEGWHFSIFAADGTKISDYVTDSTGIIIVDLEPGVYTVKETDGEYPYWHNDPEPEKTVTVVAGETAEVTFLNEWVGKAKIIKTLANPEAGTVEGWQFTISRIVGETDAVYLTTVTTGADGTIEYDLEPGQYLITELIEENSLWECITDQSVVITVTAGQTTEVPFTNALRPGKISIHKVDTRGESLDSTEFTLEWSEDGVNWQSVSYTDSTVPQIGGCTTAGLLEGGKLVTDETGLVSFEGLYPTLQYRLTETKAKNGYQLLQSSAYEGGLNVENELVVSLKVVNAEVFTMPETGGNTLIVQPWIVLALLCVSTLAVIQLMPQPKRKEK
ncbi:MAG: hypothetical protein IJ403_03260 [Oscillospiraceae bacterium]|nr:hypothetical protein [Oscillospiraceae bacterium]